MKDEALKNIAKKTDNPELKKSIAEKLKTKDKEVKK